MKKKILFLIFLVIFFSFQASRALHAATINPFIVAPASASFADQDPDLGQVTSSPSINLIFRVRDLLAGENWTLEICADTDLVNGGDSIPAGNIQWALTGGGSGDSTFYDGTLVRGVYLLAGQGNNGMFMASFNLLLQNDWSYNTGNYSGTITIRISAPGAADRTRTITLSTNIATTLAKLQLGSATMNFPSENPNSIPSIPANVNPVSVTSSARTGSTQTANLTCLASGDLTSGTDTIAISNVTWTATGSGYLPGAMNSITAQPAGTWTGSGQQIGTFSYFFANFWSYTVGNYSSTINYTLTVP